MSFSGLSLQDILWLYHWQTKVICQPRTLSNSAVLLSGIQFFVFVFFISVCFCFGTSQSDLQSVTAEVWLNQTLVHCLPSCQNAFPYQSLQPGQRSRGFWCGCCFFVDMSCYPFVWYVSTLLVFHWHLHVTYCDFASLLRIYTHLFSITGKPFQ